MEPWVPLVTSKGLCQQERGADALVLIFVVEDGKEDAVDRGAVGEDAIGLVRRLTSRKRRSMGLVVRTALRWARDL